MRHYVKPSGTFAHNNENLDPAGLAAAVREAGNRLATVRPTFVVSLDTPERHTDPTATWGISVEDVESQKTVIFWEGSASKVVHDLQEYVSVVERGARSEIPSEDDVRTLLRYLETPPGNRKEASIYKTKDGNWNLRITGTGATKIFRGHSVKVDFSEFVSWAAPVHHAPAPDVPNGQGFSRPTSPSPSPAPSSSSS